MRYFSELRPYLQRRGIESEYFSLDVKIRSMIERMGLDCAPRKIVDSCDEVTTELVGEVVNPVIASRYQDRALLDRRIANLHYLLRSFFEEKSIDAIFLWNGSGLVSSVAAVIARRRGIKCLYGENGYLPRTLQIDPQGVNQLASVTQRIASEYQRVNIDDRVKAELDRVISLLHSGESWATPPKRRIKPSLVARLRREIQNISWQRIRRSTGTNGDIPEYDGALPDNYLFLPFQVENDSQLILHSPLVGTSMAKFVEVCHGALQQLEPGMRLVVKLHPANLNQVDYRDLVARFPEVLFYKSGSIGEMIEKSRAVVTINSTVGLEALTYYKPVVTLGDNFYNVPGVVEHVFSIDKLPKSLVSALGRSVDKPKIDQFIYYLYASYFAHGSWKDFSTLSCENVADKISDLLGANG